MGWSVRALMVARPVGVLDADAKAFLVAAGITDATISTAINKLVIDLKGYGLWNTAWALWPVVGGDATKHSYNLFNTATFQLSFTGTWTHGSGGMTGDASTAYANTGLVPNSSFLTTSSGSLGVYNRTNTNAGTNPYDMGSANDAGVTFPFGVISRYGSNNAYAFYGNGTYGCVVASTDSKGLWQTNINAASAVELVKNGSQVASATEGVNMGDTFSVLIGAFNGGGTPTFFSDKQIALAFVMGGMTSTQYANFYTAVQAFQTTLGRNV